MFILERAFLSGTTCLISTFDTDDNGSDLLDRLLVMHPKLHILR